MYENKQKNASVQIVTFTGDTSQRLDNFLFARYRHIPKSRLYNLIRRGNVRVNKKRSNAAYRLTAGDCIRIPPITVHTTAQIRPPTEAVASSLKKHILYEDDSLLIVNKPAQLAVHGGSGTAHGLIERLRILRPHDTLALVHRLDKHTTGIILIAKKRSALVALHTALRARQIRKYYLALVCGQWPHTTRAVQLPLKKNILASGERIVRVDTDGKAAHTRFTVSNTTQNNVIPTMTLLSVALITGRTHQIRVHTQAMHHPIVGDTKYGNAACNRAAAAHGYTGMFLHAHAIRFHHPKTQQCLHITAPLFPHEKALLDKLALAVPNVDTPTVQHIAS